MNEPRTRKAGAGLRSLLESLQLLTTPTAKTSKHTSCKTAMTRKRFQGVANARGLPGLTDQTHHWMDSETMVSKPLTSIE